MRGGQDAVFAFRLSVLGRAIPKQTHSAEVTTQHMSVFGQGPFLCGMEQWGTGVESRRAREEMTFELGLA